MIMSRTYGLKHITKPGYGEPEPLAPVSTMDAPENVETCLSCSLPNCRASLPACPLRGKEPRVKPRRQLPEAEGRIQARTNRVRDLINRGWRNDEAICEELNISPWMLKDAKRRLRERGEIK